MNTVQIVSTIGVLGLVAWTTSQRPSTPQVERIGRPVRQACEALEETLLEVKHAWNPRVQERVIEEAKGRIDQLRPPLLWWLGRYDPPLLGEALTLAERLEIEQSRPLMLEIARYGRPELQAIAVVAAARLAPLSDDETKEFFESDVPALRAAAAEACVAEDHLQGLCDLLFDTDASVRAAASEAIPLELTKASRAQLIGLAKHAEGVSEAGIVRAVGRLHFGKDNEVLLQSKLRSESAETRAIALDALARAEKLSDASPIWSFVEDPATHPVDRARALYCLERTESVSIGQLRTLIPRLEDARCKFYAARCFVLLGAREGAAMLVALLDTELDTEVDAENKGDDDDTLRGDARRILSQLSGLSRDASVREWRDWLATRRLVPARRLSVSTLAFR